jgi:transcription initiation factor TFIIE subunit alpha
LSISEDLYLKVAGLVGGDDAIGVVSSLLELKKATDEQMATKSGLRLSSVRRVLYRLLDFSLVTYEEGRDPVTDRIIFYWSPLPDQVEGFIQTQKRDLLKRLNSKLEYVTSHEFYHCGKEECKKITFEEAVEALFKCPKCGSPLSRVNMQPLIEALKLRIASIEKEMA